MVSLNRPSAAESLPIDTPDARPLPEFPRLHQPHDSILSPSIQRTRGESIPAYELKFVVVEEVARRIEAWAEEQLERDVFSDVSHGGSYTTTTLYLDTPGFDVFHRTNGFRRRKFRLRRYGQEQFIYLERKTRWGDRVKKRRSDVPLQELHLVTQESSGQAWGGDWFRERIAVRSLRPVCRVTYQRSAFVKASPSGPLRLTFDRNIRGLPTDDWCLAPVDSGCDILDGLVVCEFKFREAMPGIFKETIAALQLQTGSVSKYRRVMTAAGAQIAPAGANDGAGAHD